MARPTSRTSATRANAIAAGYKSGLEEKVAQELASLGVPVSYEDASSVIRYTKPSRVSKYTPDFVLPNGIIIETKGRFVTADRQKHILVKAQHPELDIRFVFSNSRSRISKESSTTYAMWCVKNGFKFADRSVPEAWLKEQSNGRD
jgi:hypothetical protein